MSGAGDAPNGPPDEGAADPHVLAGELVLGVLSTDDAAAIRRAAMTDLDLADAIVRWEVRLAPLADLAGTQVPPTDLWTRLDASISMPESGPMGSYAGDNVIAMTPRPSGERRVGLWQGTTVAALALAAAFAAVAFLPRSTAPVQFAALVPASAPAPAFLAQVSADNVVIVSAISPASVPNNRDLELWLLPPGAQKPMSLGVLPATGRTLTLPGPQPAGTQLLVSLEPRGGSTTGQPTGPVLYGGSLGRS